MNQRVRADRHSYVKSRTFVTRYTALAGCLIGALLLAACGNSDAASPSASDIPELSDEDRVAIISDAFIQVCEDALCGQSPVFVFLATDTPAIRQRVAELASDVEFPGAGDELIDTDDQVVNGGRIVRIGIPKVNSAGLVLLDASWESSRFAGRSSTLVFEDVGEEWIAVDPADVGVTVTTGVP